MFFIFFVFFPKRLTHIFSKLILIFFPFLCLPFLFFHVFSWLKTQKIFTHSKKKTFKPQHYLIKPVLLPFQNFLKPSSPSLPKLSQISFELHGRPPSLITAATTTIGVGSFFSFFDQPSLYLLIRSNSYPNGSNSNSNG